MDNNEVKGIIRNIIVSENLSSSVKSTLMDLYDELAGLVVKIILRNGSAVLFPVPKYDEMINYIIRTEKIKAIKIFREVTGFGLKDSKEEVEAIMGNMAKKEYLREY